ncbi:MAG: diaminopimelate decarboxylase [Elusimicrobiales bacterium]
MPYGIRVRVPSRARFMWCYEKRYIKKILRLCQYYATPLYIYHIPTLLREISKYKDVFKDKPVDILYAFKANSNREICSVIKKQGLGADVVSGGELELALELGFDNISFSGVGKTDDEITLAVKNRISFINIESYEEFLNLRKIAQRLRIKTAISVRLNPNINVNTHRYIRTATKYSKFGVDFKTAKEIYLKASKSRYIEIKAVHFHLGSQIFDESYYAKALKKTVDFIRSLCVYGINIKKIDIGGGWGVKEGKECTGHNKIFDVIKHYIPEFSFILEPGRSIVASCGILALKVLYRKKIGKRYIIVVDGGMNVFVRPILYNVFHPVFNLVQRRGERVICDIVGPLCESSDFISKSVKITLPQRNDILAVVSAGAYGYPMSNEYNLRKKPLEKVIYH